MMKKISEAIETHILGPYTRRIERAGEDSEGITAFRRERRVFERDVALLGAIALATGVVVEYTTGMSGAIELSVAIPAAPLVGSAAWFEIAGLLGMDRMVVENENREVARGENIE